MPIMLMLHFLYFFHSFLGSVLFCFLPVSLCTLPWEVSVGLSSSSLILFLAVLSILMSPSKTFLISVIVFLILSYSFYLCAYITKIFLHISIFSFRSLRLLIIFILSSLSDNPKSFVIFELESDAGFVFSDCVILLTFQIPCNFLLKARYIK